MPFRDMHRVALTVAVGAAIILGPALDAGQAGVQAVQYRSPDGIEYRSLPDTDALKTARAALEAEPRSIPRIIDLGVAQSGARQFREAIATFTRGLEIEPANALLLRWRGHRYLSVREFDRAFADLTRGATNDSTIYGIWYHLGVVQYLRGDFADAAASFAKAQPIAPDAGELAGSTDWLWMSLSRAGRGAEAKAMLDRRPDSKPVTNAYTRRLQLYRGEIGPDAVVTAADTDDVQIATLSYGLGNWYLLRGDKAEARKWFERSIQSGGWPAFGFIASEVELRRLRVSPEQVIQDPAASAAIEKFHQQEIAATLSGHPAALTDLWTDDAVRLGVGRAPEVGGQAIRESHERWSTRPGAKVLTYVPDTKDLTIWDGWAVEWGYVTGSYVEAPGGEPKPIRGTRLMVLKKMPNGSWKCFRGMGGPGWTASLDGAAVQRPAARAGGTRTGGDADLAAFEKIYKRDIDATLSRDVVALTDPWSDDAVRIGPVPPAQIGKQAIRAFNESWSARPDVKVLTYVPEIQDLTILDGWAVEWRTLTGSFLASPGPEPIHVRSTLLAVYKKLPDGTWKLFRAIGT
jgi:tetratricopeptide (TPR) repeat protein